MSLNHFQGEDFTLNDEQLTQMLAVQSGTRQPNDVLFPEIDPNEPSESPIVTNEAVEASLLRISESDVDPDIISLIPAELAYRHQALPLSAENGVIRVAVANPLNIAVADDIRLVTGKYVELVFANPQDIRRLVEEMYMRHMIADTTDEDVQILDDDSDEIGNLEQMAREATVIKLVNLILRQAVQDRASDIHVEPFEKGMKVRYRIDGVLHEISSPTKRLQGAIISRLKIMANLDIAERRLPQDGRIKTKIAGREIDIRVSSMPTLYGESVVLRLLDRSAMDYELSSLGLRTEILRSVRALIEIPHGMILTTGPTGSGKTTTLYAALRAAYSPEKKIITIEDPIEYQLDGVNQIQVHPKIGLTFANGLRHILRQDPDVIMVGEIRDSETAEIAIHSALTGHLVFSTLHTNDAASAVTRLLEMDVEPYLVASSVEAVFAQRLVRTICPHCKEERKDTPEILSQLSGSGFDLSRVTKFYHGAGCDECKQSGYRGRIGIYELLMMDNAIRPLVLQHAPSGTIRDTACARGMHTLRDDGWEKVLNGTTTVEEVIRVTRQDEIEPAG